MRQIHPLHQQMSERINLSLCELFETANSIETKARIAQILRYWLRSTFIAQEAAERPENMRNENNDHEDGHKESILAAERTVRESLESHAENNPAKRELYEKALDFLKVEAQGDHETERAQAEISALFEGLIILVSYQDESVYDINSNQIKPKAIIDFFDSLKEFSEPFAEELALTDDDVEILEPEDYVYGLLNDAIKSYIGFDKEKYDLFMGALKLYTQENDKKIGILLTKLKDKINDQSPSVFDKKTNSIKKGAVKTFFEDIQKYMYSIGELPRDTVPDAKPDKKSAERINEMPEEKTEEIFNDELIMLLDHSNRYCEEKHDLFFTPHEAHLLKISQAKIRQCERHYLHPYKLEPQFNISNQKYKVLHPDRDPDFINALKPILIYHHQLFSDKLPDAETRKGGKYSIDMTAINTQAKYEMLQKLLTDDTPCLKNLYHAMVRNVRSPAGLNALAMNIKFTADNIIFYLTAPTKSLRALFDATIRSFDEAEDKKTKYLVLRDIFLIQNIFMARPDIDDDVKEDFFERYYRPFETANLPLLTEFEEISEPSSPSLPKITSVFDYSKMKPAELTNELLY